MGPLLFMCLVSGALSSEFFFVHPSWTLQSANGETESLAAILESDPEAGRRSQTVEKHYVSDVVSAQNTIGTCRPLTLAGLFYWPSSGSYNRSTTLAAFGAGHGHVVLRVNPELVEIPEYIFEGVRCISEVAKAAGSKVLLLMPDAPVDGPTQEEVANTAYHIGNTLGVEVVPTGLVKADIGRTISAADSNYITAACVYSHVFGVAADHAITTLPVGVTEAAAAEFAAACFARTSSPPPSAPPARPGVASWFVGVHKRTILAEKWGTSTEQGISSKMGALLINHNLSYSMLGTTPKTETQVAPDWRGTAEDPVHVFLKRSFASGPGPDDYFPTPEETQFYHTWMKFDYQYDKETMTEGTYNIQCMDANYCGSSTNARTKVLPMIKDEQKANFFPIRYFIAREKTAVPSGVVMSDDQHLSGPYLEGIASGILTLTTGRCFIGDEPADTASSAWLSWHARKTGYEMAYAFTTLQPRAPGFDVRVSADAALLDSVDVHVGFLYAPEAEVRVSIVVSDYTAANVDQNTLVFTPAAHGFQKVKLISTQAAAESSPVLVTFTTSSTDAVFSGLVDEWDWSVGAPAVAPVGCDTIAGAEYSDGLEVGSVASFVCPEGTAGEPWKLSCKHDGEWIGAVNECVVVPTTTSATSASSTSTGASSTATTSSSTGSSASTASGTTASSTTVSSTATGSSTATASSSTEGQIGGGGGLSYGCALLACVFCALVL